MISCLDVANYFIKKAYEDGLENDITNMKVQKLLYYAQSLHLALYDEPLFAEEIQAWRYGPVCYPAYKKYSEFEEKQLPVPKENVISDAEEIQELLEEVWEYFGRYHAYQLSSMTHTEFPWKKARKGLPSEAPSREPISLADMKQLGYAKLEQIERDNPAYPLAIKSALQSALTSNSQQHNTEGEIRDWLDSLLE